MRYCQRSVPLSFLTTSQVKRHLATRASDKEVRPQADLIGSDIPLCAASLQLSPLLRPSKPSPQRRPSSPRPKPTQPGQRNRPLRCSPFHWLGLTPPTWPYAEVSEKSWTRRGLKSVASVKESPTATQTASHCMGRRGRVGLEERGKVV